MIEAVQWTGWNHAEIEGFCNEAEFTVDGLTIITLEGPLHASEGDWIIKGARCEFYPCKPDIFEATYEEVEFNSAD